MSVNQYTSSWGQNYHAQNDVPQRYTNLIAIIYQSLGISMIYTICVNTHTQRIAKHHQPFVQEGTAGEPLPPAVYWLLLPATAVAW